MNYSPLNYDQINAMAGTVRPSTVKARNNASFVFWERALFQRALSVLKIETPWTGAAKDFFNYCLFKFGYVAVFDQAEYGITFQPCGLSGYDWYYQPTNALIANPALSVSLNLKIHKECEILKLTPDYMGCWDIIDYYAEKLSLLDNAINISLINNKFAFMLAAKNKAAAEALKKMLDLINSGEPAVVVDRRVTDDVNSKGDPTPWQIIDRGNLKESYLTTDQLADFRTILHNFDTEIGIPTLPIEKKERMIDSEANALETDAIARSTIWLNTINETADMVNSMFGLSIRASLTYKEKEGEENGNGTDDPDGSL